VGVAVLARIAKVPESAPLLPRIGWSVDDRMKDAEWVRGESTVGLNYMIIERSRWNEPLPFPLLYEDEDFRVYQVKK
jgi:hypothetical protein